MKISENRLRSIIREQIHFASKKKENHINEGFFDFFKKKEEKKPFVNYNVKPIIPVGHLFSTSEEVEKYSNTYEKFGLKKNGPFLMLQIYNLKELSDTDRQIISPMELHLIKRINYLNGIVNKVAKGTTSTDVDGDISNFKAIDDSTHEDVTNEIIGAAKKGKYLILKNEENGGRRLPDIDVRKQSEIQARGGHHHYGRNPKYGYDEDTFEFNAFEDDEEKNNATITYYFLGSSKVRKVKLTWTQSNEASAAIDRSLDSLEMKEKEKKEKEMNENRIRRIIKSIISK